MAKRNDALYSRLRNSGLRKKTADRIAEAAGNGGTEGTEGDQRGRGRAARARH